MTEGGSIHWTTVGITVLTIVTALLLRYLNRRLRWILPELLLAIVAAGATVWWFDLATQGVRLVESIPRQLPGFSPPHIDWNMSRELISSANRNRSVGSIGSHRHGQVDRRQDGTEVGYQSAMLERRMANLAGSFFSMLPGSGSLTRSYINHQAGAATQWSGVLCAATVALIMLVLAPWAQYIPRAALAAGVLLLAATRMIDVAGILYHCRATKFDAAIVLTTALSAVLVSVEFCILIGTLLSFLIYVPRAASVELTEMIVTEQGVIRERAETDPRCSRLKFYNFEGSYSSDRPPEFESQLEQIGHWLDADTKVLVIRIKHLRNPDAVCLDLFRRFIDRMEQRDVRVIVSGVRPNFYQALFRTEIVERLGEHCVFQELSQSGAVPSEQLSMGIRFWSVVIATIVRSARGRKRSGVALRYLGWHGTPLTLMLGGTP